MRLKFAKFRSLGGAAEGPRLRIRLSSLCVLSALMFPSTVGASVEVFKTIIKTLPRDSSSNEMIQQMEVVANGKLSEAEKRRLLALQQVTKKGSTFTCQTILVRNARDSFLTTSFPLSGSKEGIAAHELERNGLVVRRIGSVVTIGNAGRRQLLALPHEQYIVRGSLPPGAEPAVRRTDTGLTIDTYRYPIGSAFPGIVELFSFPGKKPHKLTWGSLPESGRRIIVAVGEIDWQQDKISRAKVTRYRENVPSSILILQRSTPASELEMPNLEDVLPSGDVVADSRLSNSDVFDSKEAAYVQYRWSGHFPTTEELRAMTALQHGLVQNAPEKGLNVAAIGGVGGLLVCGVSLWMWRARRKPLRQRM